MEGRRGLQAGGGGEETDAFPRRNQNRSVTRLDCPFAFNRVSDTVMLKSQNLIRGRGGERLIC